MAERAVVTCSVCIKEVEELKELSCAHSFCLECLLKLEVDGKVQCPNCRKPHKVIANGVPSFEELPDSEILEEHQPKSKEKAPTPQKCSIHELELDMFCKQCKRLLCAKCFIIGHNGHDFGTDATEEMKAEIRKLLKETEASFGRAQEHYEYTKKIEQETIRRSDEIPSEIKDYFDPMIKALQEQREELLDQAEKKCNDDKKRIFKRREVLEEVIASYKKAAATGRELTESADEQHVLRQGQEVIHNLQCIGAVNLNLEDTEALEIKRHEFRTRDRPKVEGLGELIIAEGDPELKFNCSGPPKTMHFKDNIEFGVGVSLVIKDRVLHKLPLCKPSVTIRHGHAKVPIPEPPTVERKDGQWQVSFRPVVAGHHTVTLSAHTEFCLKPIQGEIEFEDPLKIMTKSSIEKNDKVQPGPDWSQRGKQEVGTVVSVGESLVGVKWEDGEEGTYKWGEGGSYEVQVSHQ